MAAVRNDAGQTQSDRSASRRAETVSPTAKRHYHVSKANMFLLHKDLFHSNRYEPVQARVVRHVERLGVKMEDPRAYEAMFQTSLLDTEQLLSQVRQLGISDELITRGQPEPMTNYDHLLNFPPSTADRETADDDLSAQLAQYGVTLDSIPY